MEPLWKSRKFWYSVTGAGLVLIALAIIGYFKIPDLTGAAAVAAIGGPFGLSVHKQGQKDLQDGAKAQ